MSTSKKARQRRVFLVVAVLFVLALGPSAASASVMLVNGFDDRALRALLVTSLELHVESPSEQPPVRNTARLAFVAGLFVLALASGMNVARALIATAAENAHAHGHSRSRERALVFVAFSIAFALGPSIGFTKGIIASAAEDSRTFSSGGEERMLKVLCSVANEMPGWMLAEPIGDRNATRIRFEVRSPVLGFVDEVAIQMTGSERTTLLVRATSGSGLSDFGTNRRRIRELFDRIDEELRR